MTLITRQEMGVETFGQAEALKDRIIWGKLESVTVESLLIEWFETLSYRTRINYRSGSNMLAVTGLLNPLMSLQMFSMINHDSIIDQIKQIVEWSETSRQARAALYISFTRYLSRRYPSVFKKAMPCREGVDNSSNFCGHLLSLLINSTLHNI